jgi:hypothetical protein
MNLAPQIIALTRLLRRELTAIRERLDRTHETLKQHTETVKDAQGRKKQEEFGPDFPQEFRVVVRPDEATVADAKSNDDRQYSTQESIKRATWFASVVILAYAAASIFQVLEMQRQTAQLYRQAEIENAGASHRAVEMDRQLKIARQQAEAAFGQAGAAAENAKAAENNVVAVRKGIEESSKRSKEALDATIHNFHQEQRAWVGVIGVNTQGGVADNNSFAFQSVQVIVRNSGKTPALKISGECCMYLTRKSDDPIPDYDSEVRESEKKLVEFGKQRHRQIEERIRQHPEMAVEFGDYLKHFDEMHSSRTNFLHQGGVLAPEVTQSINLVPLMKFDTVQLPTSAETAMPIRFTIYILGKITYNDIFMDTPRRSTKFCLMRAGGTSLVICPENNWMD